MKTEGEGEGAVLLVEHVLAVEHLGVLLLGALRVGLLLPLLSDDRFVLVVMVAAAGDDDDDDDDDDESLLFICLRLRRRLAAPCLLGGDAPSSPPYASASSSVAAEDLALDFFLLDAPPLVESFFFDGDLRRRPSMTHSSSSASTVRLTARARTTLQRRADTSASWSSPRTSIHRACPELAPVRNVPRFSKGERRHHCRSGMYVRTK